MFLDDDNDNINPSGCWHLDSCLTPELWLILLYFIIKLLILQFLGCSKFVKTHFALVSQSSHLWWMTWVGDWIWFYNLLTRVFEFELKNLWFSTKNTFKLNSKSGKFAKSLRKCSESSWLINFSFSCVQSCQKCRRLLLTTHHITNKMLSELNKVKV